MKELFIRTIRTACGSSLAARIEGNSAPVEKVDSE